MKGWHALRNEGRGEPRPPLRCTPFVPQGVPPGLSPRACLSSIIVALIFRSNSRPRSFAMTNPWIAQRMGYFDSSGIRKVFDLAASMKDPINLSIGQPDFDVPDDVKEAAIAAIRQGKNGYALTQGMPALREKLQA